MNKNVHAVDVAKGGASAGRRDAALSPAARSIIAGALSGYSQETEWVEECAVASDDPQSDRLTVARFGSEADATSISMVVITVRILKQKIAPGEIFLILGGCARAYNDARRWRPAPRAQAKRWKGRSDL